MNQRQRQADASFLVAVECMRRFEEERPSDEDKAIILLLAARCALNRSARLDRQAKRRARLRAMWRWMSG